MYMVHVLFYVLVFIFYVITYAFLYLPQKERRFSLVKESWGVFLLLTVWTLENNALVFASASYKMLLY